MCRYPFGSGGKRVCTRPPNLLLLRSSSMMVSMKWSPRAEPAAFLSTALFSFVVLFVGSFGFFTSMAFLPCQRVSAAATVWVRFCFLSLLLAGNILLDTTGSGPGQLRDLQDASGRGDRLDLGSARDKLTTDREHSRRSGGIGRRARLRAWLGLTQCRFKSCLRHTKGHGLSLSRGGEHVPFLFRQAATHNSGRQRKGRPAAPGNRGGMFGT